MWLGENYQRPIAILSTDGLVAKYQRDRYALTYQLNIDFDGDRKSSAIAKGFPGDLEDRRCLLAFIFAPLNEGEDAADES